MNRILIVNLTRMGDLVQMLGLVGGLRRRWPQARIEVAAMRAFAGILRLFPHLDEIIELDDKLIVGKLQDDLWSGYRELKRCIDDLNRRDYDLLVSPVVSTQAAWMAYPVQAGQRRGMFINRERQQTITSQWTAFHLANEHHLGDRTFNLVDIFAHVGDVAARPEDFRLFPPEDARQKADAVWQQHNLDGREVVGVHVGASRSNKAWEPEKFREVIERLLQNPQRSVVLFGGYNELALAPFFENLYHPNFVNLIGKSGLPDLVAMLGKLKLFIANDTGPMHLAAAAGTPVLNLSLGPVSMWETGPYQPGAVILQADIACHPCGFNHVCDHLRCHDLISVNAVSAAAECMLAGNPPQPVQGVHTWRTRVGVFGMLHNVPVHRREIGARELFFACKRAVWAITLLPGLDPQVDWVQAFLQDLEQHYAVPQRDMHQWLQDLEQLREDSAGVVNALKQLAALDTAKSIDRIRETWSNIKQQKEALFLLARDMNDCYDFFLYSRFRESSLDSDDFARLTRATIEIYAELTLQLQVLIRLIRSYHADQAE